MSGTAWPTLEQVASANAEQVVRWNRSLPSAISDAQMRIIEAVLDRFRKLSPRERMNAIRSAR